MLVWLLKLLIVCLNIRSTHKALARPTRSRSVDGNKKSIVASVPKRKRLKVQVTNWVVYVSYMILEQIADRVIGWIWFYSTVKAFVLLMLLVWRGAGSQIPFDKLIKPTIKPWEGTCDFVGFVLSEVLEITVHCLLIVPRWIARRWRGRAAEPDVPSILRGLRQQNPAPRMAESMARSLERQQGNSDKINHKLSKPVTIRLNQVQATKPRRPPQPPSASIPAPVVKPLLAHPGPPPTLPPAAFSTAPFRPITVPSSRPIPSTSSLPKPVASTSRLPIPAVRPSSTTASSMYPSLQSLPPAPTYNPSQAPTKPTTSSSRPPAFKPTQKTVASPSLPDSSTPPARRTARSSRSTAQTSPPASPHRSSTPPSLTPARQIVPPTPAPPGAFSFASSVPLPDSPAIFTHSSTEQEMEIDEPEERSTPRTSARKGKATASKRSLGKVDTDDSTAETPKKKKIKSSPVLARTSVTKRKGKEKEIVQEETVDVGESTLTKPSATPRQRALGAISQLATDLMDDGEEGGISLGSPKKKSRVGVLARSSTTGAGAKGKGVARTTATRSRRGQLKESDEEVEEEETMPKKRKAGRARGQDEEEEFEEPTPPSQPQRKSRATGGRTSASTARSQPPARSRVSRSNIIPDSSATVSRSTTRSRLSSRAASPASLEPKPAASEPKATTAPKRKARRVLLGRQAVNMEDEEEIEGVAVVARSRRKPGV